jgi:hypothetical protein
MKSLPDGCVDAVITDPPYGVNLVEKSHKDKTYFYGNDGYEILEDSPEYITRVVIPAIELARRKFGRVILTPGTRNTFLYPQPDEIGGIYQPAGTGSGKWGFICCAPILFYGKDPYLAVGLGRRPNSWAQPATDFAEVNGHPCPKPIGLMLWLVGRASLKDETVLDPFLGSGTTAVAGKKLGRHFLGFEISPEYCKIAEERIALVEAQPNLFVPEPQQLRLER